MRVERRTVKPLHKTPQEGALDKGLIIAVSFLN